MYFHDIYFKPDSVSQISSVADIFVTSSKQSHKQKETASYSVDAIYTHSANMTSNEPQTYTQQTAMIRPKTSLTAGTSVMKGRYCKEVRQVVTTMLHDNSPPVRQRLVP